jgi:hypothetical protein
VTGGPGRLKARVRRAMHTTVTHISRSGWLAFGVLSSTGCPFCVATSARVRTPAGEVEAGLLRVGDRVVSIDVDSGRVVEGTIVHVRRAIRECVALRWRGGELVCTSDHPLYSPERGDYRPASDWITGGLKVLLAGTGETVAPVAVEAALVFAGVREVVDISLAGEPRNFVAAGVVVHNKSPAFELPPMETVVVGGPLVGLAADEQPHEFRVRICDGADDVTDIWSVWISATSVVAVEPASADPLWLAMYYESDGEATVLDGRVPVKLEHSVDDWMQLEATCSAGFVIGFERVDRGADGTIAVSWEVSVEHEEGVGNDPTITIVEE